MIINKLKCPSRASVQYRVCDKYTDKIIFKTNEVKVKVKVYLYTLKLDFIS